LLTGKVKYIDEKKGQNVKIKKIKEACRKVKPEGDGVQKEANEGQKQYPFVRSDNK